MWDDNRQPYPHNKGVNSIWTKCIIALLCAGGIGCERSHPGTQTAESYLEAVKFGDREQAFDLHILSTDRSDYCTDPFVRVLEKTRRSATNQACRNLTAYPPEEQLNWTDEETLAYQTFRALCEDPDLSCEGYGALVYRSAWDASSVTGQPYTIERVLGDDSRAAVYVSYAMEADPVERRTLRLEFVEESWVVTGGLLNNGERP